MTRKLNETEKGKVREHFYSAKMRTLFKLDGPLEKAMCRNFEFDDNIRRYCTQPFSTIYKGPDGEQHRYTQDALIEYQDLSLDHIEIKSALYAKAPAFQNQFACLERHYEQRYGAPLTLYKDTRYTKSHFKNCKMLYRFRVQAINPDEQRLIDKRAFKLLTFAEFKDYVMSKGLSLATAFKLLAHNRVDWELNDALTDETLLEVR